MTRRTLLIRRAALAVAIGLAAAVLGRLLQTPVTGNVLLLLTARQADRIAATSVDLHSAHGWMTLGSIQSRAVPISPVMTSCWLPFTQAAVRRARSSRASSSNYASGFRRRSFLSRSRRIPRRTRPQCRATTPVASGVLDLCHCGPPNARCLLEALRRRAEHQRCSPFNPGFDRPSRLHPNVLLRCP